ncbi:MAG TPA: hypothetical protein VJA18_01070 [Candidatus Nanoarchaeia archaeon]|nr:hypothetical protein [Candidatus Nanoarchaeia archaeon]
MENLNERFRIPREKLEEQLGIKLDDNFDQYGAIIPLRDLTAIEHVGFFRQATLERLIRNIPLRSEVEKVFPYAQAKIEIYGLEPKGLMIGQTFVLEAKILSIMFNIRKIFEGYVAKGISKMPPVQVYGRDARGERVMAFYVPPIVERHGQQDVLLDGMHRSMVCSSAGTTICPIIVSNVGAPLPFDPISWNEVKAVKEKPPVEERYINLRPTLFRDLGYVGIDG